jgi:hypothetical protein
MPVADIILDQMTSSSDFHRCHVTCRFDTTSDWKNCMQSTHISKMWSGHYSIYCMVSAYNITTKDTRVYMETDHLQEPPLRNFFESYGARSFDYDSFGSEWEAGSVIALSDVRKCAGKEEYELMETGVSPVASGAQSGGGGSIGSGEFICHCFHFFHLIMIFSECENRISCWQWIIWASC